MPAETFCKGVVNKALKTHPPGYLSIGGGAIIWKVLSWVPRWLSLWAFWMAFGRQKYVVVGNVGSGV